MSRPSAARSTRSPDEERAQGVATVPTEEDAGWLPDDGRRRGLYLLAGAVATAVVLPVAWLLITALEVPPGDAWRLLSAPDSVQITVNSLVTVSLVTAGSVVIAVPLAYLTERTDVPFKRGLTVAVSLPLVVPSYIGAFAFVSAFGPNGGLQRLLAPIGVAELPTVYGLQGTVLVLTLYTYPYVYIATRAALKTMDDRLVDAARTLGGGWVTSFRRVTAPQIQPAVAAGALLVALYTLSDFGTPAIMRYDVFTRAIYINRFELDVSSLLSLQLVAVTLFVLAVESRIRGVEAGGGASVRTARRRLGRWRWPTLGAVALVPTFALALPIGILLHWLVRSGPTGNPGGSLTQLAINSVGVSAAAALAAAVFGLPIAYLAATDRSRLVDLAERVSYVGFAIPGVVLGLAIVFFGSNYLPSIYQTMPLLIFAYVVRFLPQSVGSSRAAFLQVDPKLPDAARTLGASPGRAFRRITLPLVAPGLLAGAALVFLTTMKELPMTLMLRPSYFDTLVTRIWRAESAGYFGAAALPALVLVVVSGLSMLVILTQEGYDVQ